MTGTLTWPFPNVQVPKMSWKERRETIRTAREKIRQVDSLLEKTLQKMGNSGITGPTMEREVGGIERGKRSR